MGFCNFGGVFILAVSSLAFLRSDRLAMQYAAL
jgi:hypothetical protein